MKSNAAYSVDLKQDWCKGCYLCIDVCPVEGIFTKDGMIGNRGFQPLLLNPAGCTGCLLCELLCPDLAITISGGSVIPAKAEIQEIC